MQIARVVLESSEITTVIRENDQWLRAEGGPESGWRITGDAVEPVRFLAPIDPAVIFAIGLNYREHAVEMNQPIPDHPVVTMKNPASVIGPGETVVLPRFLASDAVDYEVELAVVIGRACKNIQPAQALDHVAGYTVANDISARDWQKIHGGGQWVRGKSFDTFCPLGPVLVTPEGIPDPGNLSMSMKLNGETMQSSNTSDMIFSVEALIAFLSGSTTLRPGTIILTGTPTGVGAARTPSRFLMPGDHVSAEIHGIGRLDNPVEAEAMP